jgi:hypothetical protein
MSGRYRVPKKDGIESVSDVNYRRHDTKTVTTADISLSTFLQIISDISFKCLIKVIKCHSMKMYGGVEVLLHAHPSSATWATSPPCILTTGQELPFEFCRGRNFEISPARSEG